MSASAQEAAAWFSRMQVRMAATIDLGVEEVLDALIQEEEPITPVVSGHMQEGYTLGTGGPEEWFLLNTAESPEGYPYPERVFDDPQWSRAYTALNRVLADAEGRLSLELDLALTRLVQSI